MKLFYFPFRQNGLPISQKNGLPNRNKNQFTFSIDNLNNLATKMANKESLQKNYTEQTRLFSLHLTPLSFELDGSWRIRK
jgi:hypothetical protein